MCGAQVRVPVGEKGHQFPLLTVTFRPPVPCWNPACPSLITTMWCDSYNTTDSTHKRPPHHTILCDVNLLYLLLDTCRDEISSPCRRVTVTSRHHCGPPLSLVLSILYFLVTFHLLLTNKQCPFFTLPINLPFMLSILYLQFRFPVGTVLVYFLSCFHSLLKACSVIYHIWNKYNKK
jgi:hypothetical protein